MPCSSWRCHVGGVTNLISRGFRIEKWGLGLRLRLGGAPQKNVADPGMRLGGVALLAWGESESVKTSGRRKFPGSRNNAYQKIIHDGSK